MKKGAAGLSVNEITNSEVAAGAGIEYSKLDLADSIVTSDLSFPLTCTSTPDTAAEIIADVQDATDNRVVCIQPGTYSISEQLDITADNLHIIGVGGRSAVTLNFPDDWQNGFFTQGSLGPVIPIEAASLASNVIICDSGSEAQCNAIDGDTMLFLHDPDGVTPGYPTITTHDGLGGAVTLYFGIPINNGANATIQVVTPVRGLTIEGLTINSTASNPAQALLLQYSRDILLKDIVIENGWRTKAWLSYDASVIIDNLLILGGGNVGNPDGLYLGSVTDADVQNVNISDMGDAGIKIGWDSYNINFYGGSVNNNQVGFYASGNSNFITVNGLSATNNVSWGIQNLGAGQFGTITGCITVNNGWTISPLGWAVAGNDS